MLILEIEYLFYLCQKSLSVNNQLLNLYNQYSDTNIHESINYMFTDNELDNFLIELINAAEYWTDIETSKLNDSLVVNYYRLADLVGYMHNVDYLMKKQNLILKDKFLCNPNLCDYQLDDSRLLSFAIDSINNTCSITLGNVLLYNDKRTNKSIPVDCGTIVVKLINTYMIYIKGEINILVPNVNTVYRWYLMETDDKLFNFGLLVLVGHRQFILQVLHSDIEVISL